MTRFPLAVLLYSQSLVSFLLPSCCFKCNVFLVSFIGSSVRSGLVSTVIGFLSFISPFIVCSYFHLPRTRFIKHTTS